MSGRVTVEETSKLFNMESQLKARGVAFLFTMASFALVGSSVDQEEECDANGKCPLAWSFTNYGTLQYLVGCNALAWIWSIAWLFIILGYTTNHNSEMGNSMIGKTTTTYAVDSFLSFLLFTAFIFAVIETNTITGGQSTIMMQVAPYRFQYGFGLASTFFAFIAVMASIGINVRYPVVLDEQSNARGGAPGVTETV